MLPLGLVLLPGALLWRAGRWVVRKGEVTRLAEVGYAAFALAVPYALVAGALALVSRSTLAVPSLPQAVLAGFLLALVAGGLGGARALAPWAPGRLLPPRTRAVFLGSVGALAVLVAAGAILAGASLAARMGAFRSVDARSTPARSARYCCCWSSRLRAERDRLGDLLRARSRLRVRHRDGGRADRIRAGLTAMLPMLGALPSGAHSAVPAGRPWPCSRCRTWRGRSAGC